MAKSTDNPSTALIPQVSGVVADIRLDKNDILTVVVSKAETMMNTKLTEALKLVKAQEKEYKDAEGALNKSVAAVGKEHFKDAIEKFKLAAEAVGAKGKLKTQVSSCLSNDRTEVNVTLQVSFENQYGNANFNHGVQLSDEQKGYLKTMEKLADDLRASREEVVTWRKKLAQLPSLERQYKAKLVESQLNKTDEGKQLLEALDLAGFEQQVLALPSA